MPSPFFTIPKKMVEAFKSYAMEVAKIRAEYEKLRVEAETGQSTASLKVGEFTLEGWRKAMANSRNRVPNLEDSHIVVMKQFHHESKAARFEVAKDWEMLVEANLQKQLFKGWVLSTNSSVYQFVKRGAAFKQTNGVIWCKENGSDKEDYYSYELEFSRFVDTPGRWRFVPCMDGLSIVEQQAVIYAMTAPVDHSAVHF